MRSLLLLLASISFAQNKPLMPSDSQDLAPLLSVLPSPKPCPPGTAFAGAQEMTFEGVIYGHFLAPGSEDAIVGAAGCEPRAAGYGGSYLLTRKDGRWRIDWYKPGIITSQCKRTALSGGRNGLVCYSSNMSQGVISETLFTLDLAGREPQRDLFFSTYDTTGAILLDRGPVRRSNIESIAFDGSALTVVANLGIVRRFRRRMPDPAADQNISVQQFRLVYNFDGDRYRPSAATASVSNLFNTQP
jgi:hypothetical protein